jgi:transketolase
VYLKGEPLPATWRGAFTEAAAALTGTETLLAKRTEQRDEAKAMTALVTEERDTARRELAAARSERDTALLEVAARNAEVAALEADLADANARIAELEGHDGEAPIETPLMEFSYLDVPVVDGFATLPDGTRIASTSDIVRVPVLSTAA